MLGQALSCTDWIKLNSCVLNTEDGVDGFGWLDTASRKFTVKSTYELANGVFAEERWGGWKRTWKLGIQQRIRVFLWILAHGS